MGKGSSNQTVTNVQKLPPAVEEALNAAYAEFNPFQKTFDAIGDFKPLVYDGPTMAEFSPLQKSAISSAEALANRPEYMDQMQNTLTGFSAGNTGIGFDPSGLQRMATATGQTRVGFDDTNLSRLANQTVDMSRLENLYGSVDPAIAQLTNLSGQTVSLDPLTAQQNRQNMATGLLGQLATDGGTNPMLQQQLDSAIAGAVDKATSQYATAGRLGSNAFGSALGAGITNAAAPIIAQNLQQDRANRLAAASALGNVSGDDLSREATLGQNIVGAGQTNLTNQVDATRALSAAFGQNLGQNTDIATNLISANQADLARQLGASETLAGNQIRTSQANADLEQRELDRQLSAINSLAGNELDASRSSAAVQLDATSRLPSLLAADQSRINTLRDVGAMQQAPAQAQIDAEISRIANQNIADQNQINALLSASGMGQGMFGTTTTQTGGGPSALQSGLGGALAGAGLANALGMSAFTPAMGAGIGGGLGLLGLLSDRRLKQDIKRIGTHANGLPIYSWNWNSEAKDKGFDIYPTEGFMAQEVKEVYPQHVYTHPSGFMMLDYASLNNETAGAA